MFQTKVVWFLGGRKMVPLVWPWRVIWRSHEGHLNFLNGTLIFYYIFFKDNYVFSLHQLIRLIIPCIKVLRYDNRKMNILQDILYFMSKYCLSSLVTQKILNEKTFNYSVLKRPRDKLQEYATNSRQFH